MNRTTRRLLAVSVSAMALNAVPALADGPGFIQNNVGNGSVTLDLSNIGTGADGQAGDSGSPSAAVNSFATGWVIQTQFAPSIADQELIVDSDVDILASATDTTAADATVFGAILQSAFAADTAGNTITVTGSLGIGAEATASNAVALGGATADANISGPPAINQFSKADLATNDIDVSADGEVVIGAIATADADVGAAADAGVEQGVQQLSLGDEKASSSISNAGNFGVLADANAGQSTTIAANTAEAEAAVGNGLTQIAWGSTSAHADLSNLAGATFGVTANADAKGSAEGTADAVVSSGVIQLAVADGGATGADATAGIVNGGDFGVNANANAVGGTDDAHSFAAVGAGVVQIAVGTTETGAASFTNTGNVGVGANATANGGEDADAVGLVGVGLGQVAYGDKAAFADIDNSGTVSLGSSASATSGTKGGTPTNNNAIAAAGTLVGSAQVAIGGTSAAVTLTNDVVADGDPIPSITGGASAVAVASNEATALAGYGLGLGQVAVADESATVDVANNGVLGFSADATATAKSDDAHAYSGFLAGGLQVAVATGGTAGATFGNGTDGTVDFSANANANGGEDATAVAIAGLGFGQVAYGDKNASAGLTNDGSFNVGASATAVAGSQTAIAGAGFLAGVGQVAWGSTSASVSLANSDSLTIGAKADASAEVEATALAGFGVGAAQLAVADTKAVATIDNTGSLAIGAEGNAVAGTDDAHAYGGFLAGVVQAAVATTGDATVGFSNATDASVDLSAKMFASGGEDATAAAIVGAGIVQGAYADDGDGLIDLVNDGSLNVGADAIAAAGTDTATAISLVGAGVTQISYAEDLADVALVNGSSGVLTVGANASAYGSTSAAAAATANAGAVVFAGIGQVAIATDPAGEAVALVDNAGEISISANADALGVTSANASALVFAGIGQIAVGSTATITNSGSLSVSADAEALADDFASAGASASGAGQVVSGTDAAAVFDNAGGSFEVAASAVALGATDGVGVGNSAVASALGLGQIGNATGTAPADLWAINDGSFDVSALASAAGATTVDATAYATGIVQTGAGAGSANVLNNTGSLSVSAEANSAGPVDADSYAYALGYEANGTIDSLDLTNAGDFTVSAVASAGDSAYATATGIYASQSTLAGTVVNSNNLTVTANAAGNGTTSWASAGGIVLYSDDFDLTVTNSGAIDVEAVVDGSGLAFATGIYLGNSGAVGVPVAANAVVDNSGSIRAAVSNDGGATYQWGTAIDVEDANHAVAVNLLGGGDIWGNVLLSADDSVEVADGETSFDGIFNPDMALEGSLNIAADGVLYLRDNPEQGAATYNGPSMVYVDSFTIDAGGTLALELPSYPTQALTDSEGYQQIVANSADVTGGVLEVRPSSSNGLYADSYYYNNVISVADGAGTGTFASSTTNNIFLDIAPIYTTATGANDDGDWGSVGDGADNIDLGITRTPFGDSSFGLTPNQNAAADGIEDVYSPTLTGPFADMLAEIFTQDLTEYKASLSTLHGAQYATYLQSLGWMGNRFNGILSDMGECAALKLNDGTLTCRREAAGIWGTVNYGKESIDSDTSADATGYDGDQWLAAIGVDFPVGDAGVLGIGGGYVKNEGEFDWYGGSVDAEGWQLGVYGAYDPGTWYIKAAVSYTDLSADSVRSIVVGPITGPATGSPDATMWAAGAEVGFHLPLGSARLTPYAGVDYVSAKLEGFTEGGIHPGRLTVNDSTDDYFTTELGAKLTGSLGSVVPEIKAAWRHEFNDDPAMITAYYAAQPGNSFTVISPYRAEDALVLGASLATAVTDNTSLKLGYEGWIADGHTVHSGGLTLRHQFGRGW